MSNIFAAFAAFAVCCALNVRRFIAAIAAAIFFTAAAGDPKSDRDFDE